MLLHVLTEKGHGVPQACEDPVTYHTPPVFEKVGPDRTILSLKRGGAKAYTDAVSAAIYKEMQDDQRVAVITAAMCQGNKLEKVPRTTSPTASSTSASANRTPSPSPPAWPRPGMRPIVDIYSHLPAAHRSTRSSRKWRCRTCR